MNDELLALADFDHRCSDEECVNFGQRTFSNNCKCHKTREQMMLEEIRSLRTLAAQSPEPVTVKPLVWVDHRPDSFPEPAWSAQTSFGFYNIEEVSASDSPAYVVRLHAHHFVADKDSLDEAKAAAQADYEARIKSALVEAPTGNGEPEPVAWPVNLHPRTLDLVQRFALALAKKLRLAEEKYGHTDGWSHDDWEAECRDHLYQHLEKGDPRDVAAYCAFMWHHGWITYRPEITAPPADAGMREVFVSVLASLAAAISILERTPNSKKAVASDKMFDTMLNDYRKALEAGRSALTAPGATTKSDGGEPLSRTAGGFPVAAAPSQAEETGVIQSTRQGAGIERGMDQSVTGGESAATKPGRSDPSSTRSDVTGDARTKIEWWLNEISECNERMWNGSRASYFGQIAKGVAQIRALLDQFEIRRK